ncbi:MAG: PfkB family carbohydrate kinase, partial [Gammaproteobacteria bacterium]
MSRGKIVVVGSSNTDMVVRLRRLPAPGETLLGETFAMLPGGKGANQAVAASRAGGRVSFIGRVGRDDLGDRALSGLAKEGIDVQGVSRDVSAPSGVALIWVSAAGEKRLAGSPGAQGRLAAHHITQAAKVFSQASGVLLQLETALSSVRGAARLANRVCACVRVIPAAARR